MKNYLAVDSGGTKVLAILYDEEFRPMGVCRTGSMRGNTTTADLVRRSVDELIETLGLAGMHLHRVTGILDGGLPERIRETGAVIDEVSSCGELEAGLSAAELFGDGLMALSGTGSSLFGRYRGQTYSTGGYGASVSDEGSGYWMAREAFGAAIKALEGRGEPTMLQEMLAEYWGSPGNLRRAIFSIYNETAKSPVACVASCAPLVAKAADAGDAVALRILRDTGRVLGEQLMAVVRLHGLPKNLPITISGSVWKKKPVLFAEFGNVLRKAGMEQEVTIPRFEPIAGVIIRHYYDLYGTFGAAERARFLEYYKDYTFSI